MTYKSGKCWCCEKKRPVDSHHLAPLEYGGDKDGMQKNLCKSCHSLAHYEAEYYYNNGKYYQINQANLQTDPMGRRLLRLIQKIVETKQEWEEDGQRDNDQRRSSAIHWDSSEELAMAHDLKRAMGFTSLERALKQCMYIMHDALKRKGKI